VIDKQIQSAFKLHVKSQHFPSFLPSLLTSAVWPQNMLQDHRHVKILRRGSENEMR